MTDLAVWLAAQLDEIERVARAATPGPWSYECDQGGAPGFDLYSEGVKPPVHVAVAIDSGALPVEADATHIALHDPAFVLAWVAAQRKIVAEHWTTQMPWGHEGWMSVCGRCCYGDGVSFRAPCRTLRQLAEPFRDRPGFREEWRT